MISYIMDLCRLGVAWNQAPNNTWWEVVCVFFFLFFFFFSSCFPTPFPFSCWICHLLKITYMCGPPGSETSLFSDGEGTICVSVLGVDYKGRVCSSSLDLLPARFLVIPNSSSNHQRQTKGTKESASLWPCHFFVQPRFLSWLDIPRAMPPILSYGPNGMTPSPLDFCLRQMLPSRPHWTSFL